MHMRRMEDGYMHRRMRKNKHMRGNDLDTLTVNKLPLKSHIVRKNKEMRVHWGVSRGHSSAGDSFTFF